MNPTPAAASAVVAPPGDLALSVVIPAYNESARLRRTLEATADYLDRRGAPYELVLVDDGSRDDTRAVAEAWAASRVRTNGSLRILRYEANRGKGYAVRYGILRASGAQILFMDADLATPIEEIEKLEAALCSAAAPRRVQYAIGSRDVKGSQLVVHQPWYREMAGRTFNKAVQLLATPGIHDTQCGFKLLTRTAAHDIFSRCTLDGFSFDVEAIYVARRLGYHIAEVPVRWMHQEGAAAFASKKAYLRQGLHMVADLVRIRRAHRGLRPSSSSATVSSTAAAAAGTRHPL